MLQISMSDSLIRLDFMHLNQDDGIPVIYYANDHPAGSTIVGVGSSAADSGGMIGYVRAPD